MENKDRKKATKKIQREFIIHKIKPIQFKMDVDPRKAPKI